MKTIFKATATKSAQGLAVNAGSRSFHITFDEPAMLGGKDMGMTPVEGLLCALGACESIIASLYAKMFDFKYQGFSVELEGDLDFNGIKGVEGVPVGLQEIRFKMRFKTEESQEKTEKFAQFIEEHCPIFATLKAGTTLRCTGVVRE